MSKNVHLVRFAGGWLIVAPWYMTFGRNSGARPLEPELQESQTFTTIETFWTKDYADDEAARTAAVNRLRALLLLP